jgi:hypothetical protein
MHIRDISAGYFSMMGIPLVAGRFFNDTDDTASGPKRVIVNEAWVKRNLQGEDPIGKHIKFTYSPTQPFREIPQMYQWVSDRPDQKLLPRSRRNPG